jgi:hypothetical protein
MAVKRKIIIVLVAALLLTAVAMGQYFGLATADSQYGYYEPVWHPDGKSIYFFERESRGIIIGAGWEHFTAPANVYMLSDHIRLINYDLESNEETVLTQFEVTPHLGRWTRRYHNRIFGWISTVIEPVENSLEFKLRMSIPEIPSSETWVYRGVFDGKKMTTTSWSQNYPGSMGSSELVLVNGEELMTIRNAEAYGAAIIKVRADTSYEVIKSTDEFTTEMVIETQLTERSRRAQIEHVRNFVKVNEELEQKYRKEGFAAAQASLMAYDEMENMGLLPRTPRIVAEQLDASTIKNPSANIPIFHILAEYYTAGMFKDVYKAISAPGTEVKISTGDHLKYYDDDVGVRLKKWRNDGNKDFIVETDGEYHRITVLATE